MARVGSFFRFEPPSIRQARLRDTTRRLTGEVLEFNELLSENLRRFHEIERRPSTIIGTATPTPTPRSPVEQSLTAGRSPLLDIAQEDIARQREGGPNIGGFLRTLEAIDAPRRFVKREVIDPAVPEFDLGPIPTETIATPFQEVMAGVARLGGVEEEQIPDVAETLGEVRITSGLIEEAASFVLDPANLVFFAGPILKGAGGAARVAQNIRRTGRVPEFVKAARRLAAQEAGGKLPTGPLRGGEEVPLRLPEELVGVASKVTPELPGSPVDRLVDAVRGSARRARSETEVLKSKELSQRVARGTRQLQKEGISPDEAFGRAKGQLKGKLPVGEFEAPVMTPEDISALKQQIIDDPSLLFFEKINVETALVKLTTGQIPQQAELSLLERTFGPELVKAVLKKRALSQRVFENVMDVVFLPFSTLTTLDHSFPLRQGILLGPAFPKEFTKSFVAGAKAIARESAAQQVELAIRSSPQWPRFDRAGLFMAPLGRGGTLAERAETVISRLTNVIPGLRQAARGFITTGNKLRFDVMKNLVDDYEKVLRRALTAEEDVGLAHLTNFASARGSFGPVDRFAPILNLPFFAARTNISRLQFVAQLVHPNPIVRRAAWRIMTRFTGSVVAFLSVGKLSGAFDVEIDPRSTNFGEVRVGKQRVDILGNFQPFVRLAAQAFTGQRKTQTGDIANTSRLTSVGRFFRSKLSPPASVLVDLMEGTTFIGERFPPSGDPEEIAQQFLERLAPLAAQDMIDAIREEGLRGGLIATAGFFGAGGQTFETPGEKFRNRFEEKIGRPYNPEVDSIVANQDEELAALRQDIHEAALESGFEAAKEKEQRDRFLIEQERDLGLPDIASGILAGNDKAGPAFVEEFEIYQTIRAAVIGSALFEEFPDRKSEVGKLLEELGNLRPGSTEFRDPETFKIDWDKFFDRREGLVAEISQKEPRLAEALEADRVVAFDENVRKVEPDFRRARGIRRDYFDLSKWIGIDVERSRQIEEVQRLAAAKNDELASRGFGDAPSETVYELVGLDIGNPQLARQAWFVRTGSKASDELRNPERDRLLIDNRELMLTFFPELFREELLTVAGELAAIR